ncbi:hypothetical protein [Beutenbergia cavernae]|uniref:hypothetical protein n=1 Tax=Beutenbergia cavernae TaxID=84757 RepID=UPI00019AD2A1|nr:hypothetical protein [Beutenbergia cavernae]
MTSQQELGGDVSPVTHLMNAAGAMRGALNELGYADGAPGGPMMIDESANEVIVAWVEEAPADVSDRLADIANEFGVRVEIVLVPFSNVEMLHAAGKLAEALRAEGFASVVGFESGLLTVSGDEAFVTASTRRDGRLSEFHAVVTELQSRGMLVEVDWTQSTTVELAARNGDTNNFRGGSRYFTQRTDGQYNSCTQGFQAQIGTTMHVLTAAHCSQFLDGRPVRTSTSSGELVELSVRPTSYTNSTTLGLPTIWAWSDSVQR